MKKNTLWRFLLWAARYWASYLWKKFTGSKMTYVLILCLGFDLAFWLKLQNYDSPLEISNQAFILTSVGAIVVLMILHYIMMTKHLWENLVISAEPNIFFLVWLCFASWSWYPLIWGLVIWLIVWQNIKAEKKKIPAEPVEENDYLTEGS